MTKKKKDKATGLEGMTFDEALARLIQTTPQELQGEIERIRRDEEEVERYVKERQTSIRRGARRAPKRFRP